MNALDIDKIERTAKRVMLTCVGLMAPWVAYTMYLLWSLT